jgi:hypothetical protein
VCLEGRCVIIPLDSMYGRGNRLKVSMLHPSSPVVRVVLNVGNTIPSGRHTSEARCHGERQTQVYSFKFHDLASKNLAILRSQNICNTGPGSTEGNRKTCSSAKNVARNVARSSFLNDETFSVKIYKSFPPAPLTRSSL